MQLSLTLIFNFAVLEFLAASLIKNEQSEQSLMIPRLFWKFHCRVESDIHLQVEIILLDRLPLWNFQSSPVSGMDLFKITM